MSHTCELVLRETSEECGQPATKAILMQGTQYGNACDWLCDEHYNDPQIRSWYEGVFAAKF